MRTSIGSSIDSGHSSQQVKQLFTLSPMSIAAVAVTLMALGSGSARAESGPFSGLGGSWSGGGTVAMADGSSERLRCRATYRVDESGRALQQDLRCASDSYRFDLSSDLSSNGHDVSGTWSEHSRNITGSVSGTATAGRVNVHVDAPGFSATLAMTSSGSKQSVSIHSQGDIRNVTLSLAKG